MMQKGSKNRQALKKLSARAALAKELALFTASVYRDLVKQQGELSCK